jgi:cyclic pyranopterin phosphate synthase
MPEQEYRWLPRDDQLTIDEIGRLTEVYVTLGVDKVRITGGEPLLRRDVVGLIRLLAAKPAIRDLALTTNGVLLGRHASDLRSAGLGRVTISLDTLQPERFRSMAQRDHLGEVLEGIRAVADLGFQGTKIDTVVVRHMNDDELGDLLEFGASVGAEVRFIEYMDVGGATGWTSSAVIGRDEMLRRLRRRYGQIIALEPTGAAPARRFALADGRTFGIISSTTAPFCSTCDRSRMTADGIWYRCLYERDGVDLRTPLRTGCTDEDLRRMITDGWQERRAQGAVDRQLIESRGTAVELSLLKQDPHLEMHTRGG